MADQKSQLLAADRYQLLVGVRELVGLISAVEAERSEPISVSYEARDVASWDDVVVCSASGGPRTHYQVKRTGSSFDERAFEVAEEAGDKNLLRLALLDAKKTWTRGSRFVLSVWGPPEVVFHNRRAKAAAAPPRKKPDSVTRLSLKALHDLCEVQRNPSVQPWTSETGEREAWRQSVEGLLGSDASQVLAAFSVEGLGNETQLKQAAVRLLEAWYCDAATVFDQICAWLHGNIHAAAVFSYPQLHEAVLAHHKRRQTARHRLIVVCSGAHPDIHVGGTLGIDEGALGSWEHPSVIQIVGAPAFGGVAAPSILRFALHALKPELSASDAPAWRSLFASRCLTSGSREADRVLAEVSTWVGRPPPPGTHWVRSPAALVASWSDAMTAWTWSRVVSHVESSLSATSEAAVWRRWRAEFDAMTPAERGNALGTMLSTFWERANLDYCLTLRVGRRAVEQLRRALVMAVEVADALEHDGVVATWDPGMGAISIGSVVVGNVIAIEAAARPDDPARIVLVEAVAADAAQGKPLLIWTAADALTTALFTAGAETSASLATAARGFQLLVRDQTWIDAGTRNARREYLRQRIEPIARTADAARRLEEELRCDTDTRR